MKSLPLIVLSLCSPILAQVTGSFSPGPLDSFLAVGSWEVSICNDYSSPISIPPERISLSAPSYLRLLRPAQAIPLMAIKRSHEVKFILTETAEYALMGAGVLGGSGVVAISKHGLAVPALGTGVAHQLQDKWRSEIPPLPPASSDDLFSRPVVLSSGQCASRSVYAMKIPRSLVKSVPFSIALPK